MFLVSLVVTMKKFQKQVVGLILLIGIFAFLIAMLAISFLTASKGTPSSGLTNFFVVFHIELMIVLGLLGIGIGVMTYVNLRHQKADTDLVKKKTAQLLQLLLDSNEYLVLQQSVAKRTTQADISRQLGKVKAHRTLQRLEQKGLVTLQSQGKTNIITVVDSIIHLF